MANNIFKRVINALRTEKRGVYYGPTNGLGLPYGYTPYPISTILSMQLSTVYRCVDVISDAIATQTWEVLNYVDNGWKKDEIGPIAYLLNNDPSPTMSRYTLIKTLIAKTLLEGYGFLIINRPYPMGDPDSFTLVTESVKIFKRADGTLYYEVGYPGKTLYVDGNDMIHLLNYSYDGINGVSTLTHAANAVSLSYSSEQSAQGFFASGANMSGILQSEGKLTKEKALDIKSSWAEAFNVTSGNPGGIAVMEAGLTFIPVTVNPKDAQMLETRKYNVVDICRFFGVHPSKVFDDNNLTYSNIESFQLGFITDTVAPWDAKIEAEFNRKILRPSKRVKTKLNLSITELYRANLDTKANYATKMFQCGGYTVNEVRKEAGNSPVEGGNKAYVPMNMIAVDAPITQNKKLDKKLKIDKNAVVD
jgi:HK97 family phage portal protein